MIQTHFLKETASSNQKVEDPQSSEFILNALLSLLT